MLAPRTIAFGSLLALCVGSAAAATIERNYFLDTSLAKPGSGLGHWEIERFPIAPFAPSPGDTLVLHITFDRPLMLEDLGLGEDSEAIIVNLDTGITTSGGADALSYGTFQFLDAAGDLLTPTLSFSTDSGGWGIGVLRYVNMTNSSFTFSRLDVTWTLSWFYFTPPANQFEYLWVTFGADRITVMTAPEPSTLLQQLLDDVTGQPRIGPGTSLGDKIALAQVYYAVPDIQATCAVLDDFINQVGVLLRVRYDRGATEQLITDAEAIKTAIACPAE